MREKTEFEYPFVEVIHFREEKILCTSTIVSNGGGIVLPDDDWA